MKQILRSGLILLFIQQLWGCQHEIREITPTPDSLAIHINSPLAGIIQQTTRNRGSYDSIIDRSNCTSIKFPFTVIVNGQAVLVESESDIEEVKMILEASGDDDDSIEISFPVTIVLPDYTELNVDSEDELEDIIGECESEEHDEIECIDFKFPLQISIYDSDNQLSDVVDINSDKELYDFFEHLDEDDFVSLNYPITLVLSGGQEITVNGNSELEESIAGHSDDCYENEDHDDEEGHADSLFIEVITSGKWKIEYFFDEADLTSEFTGFEFIFNKEFTAEASDGTISQNGTWEFYAEDGNSGIELDFGTETPFDLLHEDWDIIEYDSAFLELKHSDETDSASFLNFRKI